MNIQTKSLMAITEEAIRVLCKESGVVNTVRFLNQFTTGNGNYTEQRDQLFDGATVSKIVSEIKRTRRIPCATEPRT
jgi:hypothetical protein